MKRRAAFTLIELLVVVAIIIALLAILMPSFGRAIEVTNRAVCASNQRQNVLAVLEYAAENFGHFPDGTNDDGHQRTGHISTHWYTYWTQDRQLTDPMLSCPNMLDEADFHGATTVGAGGFRTGFHRFWGLGDWTRGNPGPFVSPRRVGDPDADPEMIADVIRDAVVFPLPGHAIGAHGRGGNVKGTKFFQPHQLEIEGSNVGTIDASVVWRDLADQQVHRQASFGGNAWW